MNYSIEGKFLTQTLTGTQRYAAEIVLELDKICQPGQFNIVIPEEAKLITNPALENIEIVRYGKRHGPLWTQLDYYGYCKENKRMPVCLTNVAPLFSKGVVVIHDISPKVNPSFYGWKYRLFQTACYWFNMRFSKRVLTVSDFSRREIERYYPAAKGKIEVVPNAWQHIERVESDSSVLDRNGLKPGSYFFAMSSLAPNKNLRWIVETALLNPTETFAVAGGINSKVFGEHDIPRADNVRYLGYVTDGEAKALMSSCRCFLYPTFYEGFGIPPMEALASGAPAIAVSDTEVMHEVYGGSAAYVDPRVPCGEMDKIASDITGKRITPLKRYNWADSAQKLYTLLKCSN